MSKSLALTWGGWEGGVAGDTLVAVAEAFCIANGWPTRTTTAMEPTEKCSTSNSRFAVNCFCFLSTTYTEPTMTCVIILSRIYSNVYKKSAAALCSVVVAKALKCCYWCCWVTYKCQEPRIALSRYTFNNIIIIKKTLRARGTTVWLWLSSRPVRGVLCTDSARQWTRIANRLVSLPDWLVCSRFYLSSGRRGITKHITSRSGFIRRCCWCSLINGR